MIDHGEAAAGWSGRRGRSPRAFVRGETGQKAFLFRPKKTPIKISIPICYRKAKRLIGFAGTASTIRRSRFASYGKARINTRPIIAKRIVEIALAEGADDAICHGCTGKGNDQVRFELAIKRFAPEMKIIAPWRIWDLKSREEEIDYAEAHGSPEHYQGDKLFQG